MALIAVCSVKGRPGVTTAALGLAAVLPASARPVVVECDPAGGDLAVRHGIAVVPGVVELAAAVHRPVLDHQYGARVDGGLLSRYAQRLRLAGQVVEVVVSPPGGAQAAMALGVLAQPGQPVLCPPERVVVADCGRLERGSAAWPLLRASTVTVLLLGGDVEDVAHARARLSDLSEAASGRLVVVAVAGRYGAGEIGAALAPVWPAGVRDMLPVDRHAAAVLSGDLRAGGRWRRTRLASALTRLAAGLPLSGSPRPGSRPAEVQAAPSAGPPLGVAVPLQGPFAGMLGERHG